MKRLIYSFLFLPFFLFMKQNVAAQKTAPLYTDSIPNSRMTPDEETTSNNGVLIINKVSRPTLTSYLPVKEKATGAAVIICPGGGYSVLAAAHEGSDVAKEFMKNGVAAFVLKYRIPDDKTMVNKEIGPLQDAQEAIKTVREHAKEWNIDTSHIGIMGFSAGGHLASTAGTHYNKAVILNPNNTSLRPDFMLLIYPVISFDDSIGHRGSRDNLIGKNPSEEKKKYYSNELQVTADTPPTFLVHASDDEGVYPENSIRFYQACLQHHVPVEMHLYQNGGHGFGMHLPKNKDLWMDRCLNWMAANGWMKGADVRVPIK